MRGSTTNKHSTASVLAATDKENATHVLELGPDGSSSSSSGSSAGSSGSLNRDSRAKRRRTDDAQGLLRVNTEHRRRKQASIARHGRRPDSIDDRDWARQQDVPTPRNSFTAGSATVSFQRRLARPRNLPTLSAGDLVACHPAYAGLDLNQIRADLAARGPALAAALHSVRAAPTSTVPHTLDAVVASLDDLPAGSALPTHFFAVHAKFSAPSPTRTARRSVTLFPAHDIVFQAHCAKLAPIPAALDIPAEPAADGKSLNVTLPVVPLCLPSPKTFGLLQHYLYNQDVDSLATALLPGSSDIIVSGDEGRTQTVNLLARHMAARLGPAKINEHVLLAHGLWSNIAVLGISDDGLWTALDFFWDVLMHALHLATLLRPTEDLLLGPAPVSSSPAPVAASSAPSSASSSDSSSSGESDSESGHSDSTALTTPPASPVVSPCLHPSEPKLPDAVPTQMDTSC